MDTSIHNISFSGCDNNSITYLVCGVHDRLILDTFDAQHDLNTQSRDILGSTYTLTSACTTARSPTSFLPALEAATWIAPKKHAGFFSRKRMIVEENIYILTRVTGCEELFGVMPAITIPAHRFGNSKFEIERGCLVGGRGRYGAIAATCGSRSHCVLDISMDD